MSQKMTSLKGTPMYWAPEAFSRVVGRPCDWWGMGMILLELLAGEHPLEGLTDSQIIHKLTIGNVEVPDSLGPEWVPLVKGLLTKDDRRRWGYDEVARWLAGERGVPVYYEEPIAHGARFAGESAYEKNEKHEKHEKHEKNPFRFEGKEYFTMEDLARALAVRESPWFSGVNYLRYIRQWLESNMLFDEAVELGNMIFKMNAEEALFRFVHSNARCPFSLLGKLVDVDNLYLFLARVVRREASISENRLVSMLGNGQLSSFYESYISLGGERDPLLHRLLLFMDRKTPLEQWNYFEAMRNPEAYVWPEDARQNETRNDARDDMENMKKSMEQSLEVLEKMGVPPMKREDLEKLEKTYVLPRVLLSSLRAPSSYASAVERMETWRRRDLLLSRESAHDSFLYENLSLEDYARAARVRCLGHTPAILEKLDFLIDELAVFPRLRNDMEAEMVMRTTHRLRKLKEEKISPVDSLFIAKTSGLFQKRRSLGHDRLARYAAGGVGGGLFSLFVRFVTGTRSNFLFRFLFAMTFAAGSALFVGKTGLLPGMPRQEGWNEGQNENERRRRGGSPIVVLPILVVYLSVMVPERLLLLSPYIFISSIGALLGCLVCYGLDWLALARNERAVVENCAFYCEQTAGQEDEDFDNLRRRWF
jgi:hypothetical protein